MRLLAIVLTCLLIAIQYPLWFGKGGWLRAWELERQLAAQREVNAALTARNAELAAEVTSLREGREAIEERARHELNMVRDGEVFFQLIGRDNEPPADVSQPKSGAASRAP
jgi:cell division protein FtsB